MDWTLVLNNLIGFAITIFMAWFAWESTLIVEERNKARRKAREKYNERKKKSSS